MFLLLNCLDRWKVPVLAAFFVSLLMLEVTVTDWTLLRFFDQTESSKYESNAIVVMNEEFSFPGINETDVLSKPFEMFQLVQYTGPLKDKQNEVKNIIQSLFRPALSQEERQVVLVLFQAFIRACVKFNIPFFLYGGTLLGSMRHHDLIPWDDDVDVMVNATSKSTLRHALSSTGNTFRLYTPKKRWWKFYWANSNTLPDKPFRWPYIDIFFFAENKTHIFDQSHGYKNTYSFPKQQVFPLSFHPFAGAMLPVPCKLRDVVTHNYSPQLCRSPSFNHKMEQDLPRGSRKTISCKHLEHIYPFVKRRVVGNLVHEDLMKGNTLISSVTLLKDCS